MPKRRPEYARKFERQLLKKQRRDPRAAVAVVKAVNLLLEDPWNKGLNPHRLIGSDHVWEAYGSRSIRVTYEVEGDVVIFRSNCRHDIIDRRQW